MSKETDILLHACEHGFNVLLTGRHGVGKTAIVREVFDKLGWVWKYFSASTIDPWVDLVGVPKEKNGVLELIRPASLDFDNIEAIFLDEYNRAPKKVRNAVMELIQFKSINGKKFPKLKVVFAAINPDDDEQLSYDVEKLDPSQIDRFHMILPIKNEPSANYFKREYQNIGSLAVKWWLEQTKEVRELISPRRLEAGVQVWKTKGDPRYCFDPTKVNVAEFTEYLDKPDPIELLDKMCSATDEERKKFLLESNTFKHIKKDLMGKERYLKAMAHCLPETELMKEYRSKKGNRLISHVIQNVDRFKHTVAPVLSNPTSYNGRLVDAFTVYQESDGAVSSPAAVNRQVMLHGEKVTVAKMVICFSGGLKSMTRSEAQDLVEDYGAQVSTTINFKTTHLVTGKNTGQKLADAKKNKVTIITENEFKKMVQELNDPQVSGLKNNACVINGRSIVISELTLENYNEKTGQRFRIEKWDKQNGMTRQEAFNRMINELNLAIVGEPGIPIANHTEY